MTSLTALNTGEEVQHKSENSIGEITRLEMKWPRRSARQKLGVRSPAGRSLRSCKRLLMGFGFISACGRVITGIQQPACLGFGLENKTDPGFPPCHAPPTWGVADAQSVPRDLTLLERTSCTVDLNAMKMSVSRLKAVCCWKVEMLWGQITCLYPWASKKSGWLELRVQAAGTTRITENVCAGGHWRL